MHPHISSPMRSTLTSRAPAPRVLSRGKPSSSSPARRRPTTPRAGPLELVGDLVREAVAKGDDQRAREAERARDAPAGVPPPPVIPVQRPATFGFVDNAERWNGRASMVGWWSLLAVEAVAGRGLLDVLGFETGHGINFTF